MKHTQAVSRIFLALFIMFFMVFGVSTTSAKAQETIESDRIAELIERIQALQAQVKALQEQYAGLQTEIQEAMQLTRTLARGMSGEDVEELQELLATDTELYPEGLVTGFYGPMTERAIERLQARFGIEQVGTVGPVTRRTVNELFKEYRKEHRNMFKAVSVDSDDDDDEIDYSEFQPGVKNILVCHAPGGNESKGHTIAVGGPAVQAHLAHGDSLGRCDDDDDEDDDDSDDDDDENDDESDDKEEALEDIDEAEEAIDEAEDAIDEAEDAGADVTVAEELLADARELLADAKEAFNNEEYENAEDLADEADELADDAEDAADEAREEVEDAE